MTNLTELDLSSFHAKQHDKHRIVHGKLRNHLFNFMKVRNQELPGLLSGVDESISTKVITPPEKYISFTY